MSDETKYADRMAEKLREWERDIRNLKARADEAGGEAKKDLEDDIAELEKRRDEAQEYLAKAQRSSSEAGEELWAGFQDAGRALSQAWDRARARF